MPYSGTSKTWRVFCIVHWMVQTRSYAVLGHVQDLEGVLYCVLNSTEEFIRRTRERPRLGGCLVLDIV